MKLLLPNEEIHSGWDRMFGASRNDLIVKILRGDWFRPYGDSTIVRVNEDLSAPFALNFEAEHAEPEKFLDSPHFGVTFSYNGCRSDILLKDIFFHESKRQKLGEKFLRALVDTALDIGSSRLLVEPAFEGAWYWTKRGAIIQGWPMDENELCKRMKALAGANQSVRYGGLSESDFQEIGEIIREHNLDSLNGIVGREDLSVTVGGETMPFLRYILENVSLGVCVFDFDDDRTQTRFLKKVGIDIVAERAGREVYTPDIPVRNADLHAAGGRVRSETTLKPFL